MDLMDSTDIEGLNCVPDDANFFQYEQGETMKHTDGEVCEKPPPSRSDSVHTDTSLEENTLDKGHSEKACNIPEKQICDSQFSRSPRTEIRKTTEADDQLKGTLPCEKAMEVTKDSGDMDISVVPQRCEETYHPSVVDSSCDADVPKGTPKDTCEGQFCGFCLPVFQEARADEGLPGVSIDVFTLAHQAGVLSEENAFEKERKLDPKAIEQTDGVACVPCVPDDSTVASTEEYIKSIMKRPNNVENSQRKPNTVHFASPIMFVSVIEETEEDECSEDTVILSPDDTSMYCQEVPAFYEDLNEENHHMPPPVKKIKLSEALSSDGVNSSSSHSLKRYPDSFSRRGNEEDILIKDTDISTTILGAGPKDNLCTEQGAIKLHTLDRHTQQGDAGVYQVDSPIPTSTKTNYEQVKDCVCSSRSMITNGLDNAEEVQVVPEHFSKRTITRINLFSEKTIPNDDQLELCPSLLRLDEAGAFLEEEDDGPPYQHLKRVPRPGDILDMEASFYREESDLDMPLAQLCSELQSMEFEPPASSKDFDSFDKEPLEEMSDSQVSDSWITTSQVLTENTTSETTGISASSAIHSDDAISTDHRFQTKQEMGESQAQRPHLKHSAKISDPETVIRVPQNVPQDKIAQHQRLSRPMTINEQNFNKRLHRCINGQLPVVSNERAALPSSSRIPENRTNRREWNEHGVSESDEISPNTSQDPAHAVEQLRVTHDDDHVLLSSKSLVSVSRCYRDGECEYSVSDSQTLGSDVHRIEPSEHGVSEDEISPNTRQDPAVEQLRVTHDDDHELLPSKSLVSVSRCHWDGECEEYSVSDSQTLGSDVHRIEPSEKGVSEAEVSPNTRQDPAVEQLHVTHDDNHVLLSSKSLVSVSRCYRDGECKANDSQTLESDVHRIEPSEHGVSEDEISPNTRQDPAVEQLHVTHDDNHVLLSSKSLVSVSRCYRDGECKANDSKTLGSDVHRIEPSEHGDSEDEISPSMKHETAPVQQPEDDHVPLSSERTVPMSKCYQDGECRETLSYVQHTEPEQNESCGGKDDSPRQNLEPCVTQEKGYKSAHEALAEMDIDLDGPELLEFAMFLVKGALQKSQPQKEQLDKDENTKFAMKVPSAFQWQGKLKEEHLASETNSVDGKVCAALGNLASQVDASTEDAKSPLPKVNHSNRPRRVGLSRRQKVKPLHPYLTRIRQGASHRTSDD